MQTFSHLALRIVGLLVYFGTLNIFWQQISSRLHLLNQVFVVSVKVVGLVAKIVLVNVLTEASLLMGRNFEVVHI